MTDKDSTIPTSDASAARGGDGRRARFRARSLWVLVILMGAVLLVGVALVGYVWWAMRAPAGAGPMYLSEWERAVAWRPDDVRARVELGYAYRVMGKYAAALEQFDYVVRREPMNAAARYNRGMIYLAVGNDAKAEQDLWVVLDARPDHTAAAVALGDHYADKGEWALLLAAVRPAVQQHPSIARLQYLTGLGDENTGHPYWAAARYRRALVLDSDLLEARRALEQLESRR